MKYMLQDDAQHFSDLYIVSVRHKQKERHQKVDNYKLKDRERKRKQYQGRVGHQGKIV